MSNAVPHGWSVQPLGKLADVRSSNVDKKSDASELPVRLCNYTDVYYRNRITSDIDFMHATAKQGEIDRFALEKGDVIITKDSETPDDIAVPALVSESLPGVICGYHLTLLRPEPDRSNGEFLAHLFQLQSVQHYFYLLANGTTRFGLTAEAINTAPLITPPLPEQQKIATILSSVDDVIEKTRAQIDKLKDLKIGMMQELLTKGIGHTEFKDSPVGQIPASWSVQQLNKLVTIKHGFAFEGEFFSATPTSNILLTPGNFNRDGRLYFGPKTKYYDGVIPSEYILNNGDVLTVMTDLTKEMAILGNTIILQSPLKVLHNQRIGKVEFVSEAVIDSNYLCIVMNSDLVKKHIKDTATGTTVRHTSPTRILEPLIPVSSLFEQKRIVECYKSLDSKLSISEKKLAVAHKIKKALMQDLLTGKVRVNLTDKESAAV